MLDNMGQVEVNVPDMGVHGSYCLESLPLAATHIHQLLEVLKSFVRFEKFFQYDSGDIQQCLVENLFESGVYDIQQYLFLSKFTVEVRTLDL